MSLNPSGSGAYNWRWYFRESSTGNCPTGASIPSGWNTNTSSPNISGTTLTGAGVGFDPLSAGALNAGRTFAVLITPIANGNSPACGSPSFAASCRKTFVNACSPEVVTDVEEVNKNEKIQIYPNPIGDRFTIDLPLKDAGQNIQIYIYDAKGALIFAQKQTIEEGEISISSNALPRGIYQLVLHSGSGIWKERLVK